MDLIKAAKNLKPVGRTRKKTKKKEKNRWGVFDGEVLPDSKRTPQKDTTPVNSYIESHEYNIIISLLHMAVFVSKFFDISRNSDRNIEMLRHAALREWRHVFDYGYKHGVRFLKTAMAKHKTIDKEVEQRIETIVNDAMRKLKETFLMVDQGNDRYFLVQMYFDKISENLEELLIAVDVPVATSEETLPGQLALL